MTDVYDARSQWLADAQAALDAAVAAAYGWEADVAEEDALGALLGLIWRRAVGLEAEKIACEWTKLKQPDGRKNSRNSCQHVRACNVLAWMVGRPYGLSDPEDDHCTKGDTNNAEGIAQNNEGTARR